MDWIVGNWPQLGIVAGKAALMFAVAVFGLRLGQRRTLAQWTIIDFVTAVAVGPSWVAPLSPRTSRSSPAGLRF